MAFLQNISSLIWGTIRSIQNGGRWIRNKYSSQVQARINPYSTCFSHCTAWLLQNVEPDVYGGDPPRLTPDDVTREINSPVYEKFAREHPKIGAWGAAKYRGNLNQLWHVQERYINDKLIEAKSKARVVFNENTGVETIKAGLTTGPVIVNVKPVYKGERLGHIDLIVGYAPEQDQWTVDDAFGDFRTGYASGHVGKGDDIPVSVSEFEKIRGRMAIYPVR